MRARWRKSKLTLTTSFILSAALAAQGYADHGSVELLDTEGNSVFRGLSSTETIEVKDKYGNVQHLKKGKPVSWEKTCGQCHEEIVEDVRMSHHGAVGIHDMGWMDNEETHGDDTGTKDFVTNKVLKMRYSRTKSHYGGW